MIGGLWNGLSGISTFEKALTLESNNAANVNTIGHKADDIRFEDLMYSNGYGKGSAVEYVSKNMTQGNLKITNNTFDVAINGKGYFIVEDKSTNETYYTRAGNFQMAADGFLKSSSDMTIKGLTPQVNSVISSNPTKTQFDNSHIKFVATQSVGNDNFLQTINARATDYNSTATDIGISGEGFKTKSALITDIDALISDYKNKLDLYSTTSTDLPTESLPQITEVDFSSYMNELDNENDVMKLTVNNKEVLQVFDTDIETTMKKFSDKVSNVLGLTSTIDTQTGILTITSLIPAKKVNISDALINDNSITPFNTQDAKLGTGIGMVNSARDALKNALELANAELLDITNTISLVGQENLAVNDIQLKLANLNLSKDSFGTVEIDNGIIYVKENDNKFIVGKLQTAFFTNDYGLLPQGDNLYINTPEAGTAKYAGTFNKLSSGFVESSSVNTGQSLTNLLIYQKAFEANSKSITTSDEMLKIAMELKK